MINEISQKRGFPPNAVRICIDWYGNDLKGRVYTKISDSPVYFENCKDLFLKTDILFDRCGYPQTFQEKRKFSSESMIGSFSAPKICFSDEELIQQEGTLCTLDVLINSRRRAGWQGIVTVSGSQKSCRFQGELELLHYIRKEISGENRFLVEE